MHLQAHSDSFTAVSKSPSYFKDKNYSAYFAAFISYPGFYLNLNVVKFM